MFIAGDLSIQFKSLSEEQLWIKGHFQTEDQGHFQTKNQGPKSHLHLASLLDTTKTVSSTTVKTWLNNA